MTADFSLSGRTIVITGAAGQLGRAFSQAIHGAGATVVLLDHAFADPQREEQALDAFHSRDRVVAVSADVTDRRSCDDALAQIEARFGTPDGLVNCAALDNPPSATDGNAGAFEDLPDELFRQVMDVNVHGVVHCCQVFGGAMAAGGGGSIVNIASIYGVVSPDQRIYEHLASPSGRFVKPASYTASKAAVLGLTKWLAVYWADAGVRVNTLTLGGVFNGQDEQFLANYTSRVPMGRMADEHDYDGAVVFLLAQASRYMTGSNMVIDGGWTAW